jgi:hypothetical protein
VIETKLSAPKMRYFKKKKTPKMRQDKAHERLFHLLTARERGVDGKEHRGKQQALVAVAGAGALGVLKLQK